VRRLAPTATTAPLRLASALAAALMLWLALGAPLAAGETALEREVTKIYEDCGNSTEPTGFSQQAYSRATKEMPAILAEYNNCPDLINKAQLARASGHGNTGAAAAGTSTTAVAPPTPTEQRVLESIPHVAAPSVPVGGTAIHPGVVHVNLASALSTLPTPLLVLLAFILACAALLIGRAVRNRLRTPHADHADG
jgi:hypothetical protein